MAAAKTDSAVIASIAVAQGFDAELVRRLGRAAAPVLAFTRLCCHNSDVLRHDEGDLSMTGYHSVSEPKISLPGYLERLMRHTRSESEVVMAALILAARCRAASGVTLTRLSGHRLSITAMLVAAKMHVDLFPSNASFAKAGALSLSEMNALERAFFKNIGMNAVVTNEELTFMEAHAIAALQMWHDGHDLHAAHLATIAFFAKSPEKIAATTKPQLPVLDRHAAMLCGRVLVSGACSAQHSTCESPESTYHAAPSSASPSAEFRLSATSSRSTFATPTPLSSA